MRFNWISAHKKNKLDLKEVLFYLNQTHFAPIFCFEVKKQSKACQEVVFEWK